MSSGKNDRVPPIFKPERLTPPPDRGGSPSYKSNSSSASKYSKYSRSNDRSRSGGGSYNDYNRKSSSSSYSSYNDGRRGGRDNGRDCSRDSKSYASRSTHSYNDYGNKFKYNNSRSPRYNSSYGGKSNYDKPSNSSSSQGYDKKPIGNNSKYDRYNRNRGGISRTSDAQLSPPNYFQPSTSSSVGPDRNGLTSYSEPDASTSHAHKFPMASQFLPPPLPTHFPPSPAGTPSYSAPSTSHYASPYSSSTPSPYPPSTPSYPSTPTSFPPPTPSYPQGSPAYSVSSQQGHYYTPRYFDPSQSPIMSPGPHVNTFHHPVYGAHSSMAVPPGVSNPYYPKPPEPKEAPPKPAKPRVNKNDELINNIVNDMKNNGSFDDLRKICLNHLQNNETYINAVKHATGTAENIIKGYKWTPKLDTNKIRNEIRAKTERVKFFQTEMEELVKQAVNEDTLPLFRPLILESVNGFIGAKEKKEEEEKEKKEREEKEKKEQEEQEKAAKERLETEKLENEKKEEMEKAKKLETERLKQELPQKSMAAKTKSPVSKKQNVNIDKLKPTSPSHKLNTMKNQSPIKKLHNKNGLIEKKVNGQHEFLKPKTPPREPPVQYDDDSEEDEEDESPNFEALEMASPPRVTREEIEETFTYEMKEELRRLAAVPEGHLPS